MAAQPAESRARRRPTPGRSVRRALPAQERRGWLSHGLAALAISALGLAVAGSVSLTTSAQTITAPVPVTDTVQSGQQPEAGSAVVPGTVPGTQQTQTQTDAAPSDASVAAFSRPIAVASTGRTPQLQAALVRERAAQRAEDLAKSAQQVSQAARDAGGAARSQELVTTERATRQAAVKLAQQRLAEAIRQRVAAEAAQGGVQSTATGTDPTTTTGIDPTTTGGTGVDTTTSVAAGGGSSSPVPGAVIGAHFGQYGLWSRYHTGLDFRASYGTPIRAVANGVVIYAGNSGDWAGNHVAIRHAGGVTSMSSHMSSMAVTSGQSVKAGQVIGYVGQTGRAFGAHLHFELYPVGVKYGDVYKAVNPVPWLRSIGVNVN